MDFEFFISVDSMSQEVSMGHIGTFGYAPKWPWQSFEVRALSIARFSLVLRVPLCLGYCVLMAEIMHVGIKLDVFCHPIARIMKFRIFI